MVYCLAKHVSVTDTDYGAVALDERNGHYWELNETAAHVLFGLLAGRPVARVAEELASAYDVEPALAQGDIVKSWRS